MALRSQTLRIARALTKELHPSARRSAYLECHCFRNHRTSSAWSSSFVSANASSFRSFSAKSEEMPSEQQLSSEEVENPPRPSAENDATDAEAEDPPLDVTELESQIKDLKDSLLRSLAEQDNTRRIAARDVSNAKSFAITSFAKSLLETSDNLSRALDAVPEEVRNDFDNHPVLANLYEGIAMTDDGLNKAFAKNGLVKFGAKGDKFDPNLHQALFEYPDPEGEVGNIGQVTKVGFLLNERVIRPAEVGVIKAL